MRVPFQMLRFIVIRKFNMKIRENWVRVSSVSVNYFSVSERKKVETFKIHISHPKKRWLTSNGRIYSWNMWKHCELVQFQFRKDSSKYQKSRRLTSNSRIYSWNRHMWTQKNEIYNVRLTPYMIGILLLQR